MKIALAYARPSSEEYVYDSMVRLEPLGLLYLSSRLLQQGHETLVINQPLYGHSNDHVLKLVKDFQPDLMGFSLTYANFLRSMDLAGKLKEILDVPVIAGGGYPTSNPHMLTETPVDILVLGEGEDTLSELTEKLASGKDLQGLPGSAWLEDGEVRFGPPRPRILDLDSLPFPDRRFSDPDRINLSIICPGRPDARAVTMVTSRGCGNQCGFCSSHYTWQGKWISRSPENVVEEILDLKKNQKIDTIFFQDEEINFNRDRALALYELIRKKVPGFRFFAATSVKNTDLELAQAMVDAGLRAVFVGYESGSPDILRHLGKRYHPEDGIRLARFFQKKSVFISGNFMLGLPWETEETLKQTRKFGRALNLDMLGFSFHRPEQGTPFYEICKKNSLFVETPYDPVRFPPHENPVRSLFLNAKEIQKAAPRLMLEVYGRPWFWLRLLSRSLRDPEHLASYALFVASTFKSAFKFRSG